MQVNEGPIKPILKRIGEIISFFEEDRVVKSKANNNTIFYRYSSEYSPEVRQRIKIEINCREHFNVLGWKLNDFDLKNEWFDGKAQIRTYQIDELLGTKLRALYQRNKGRDLFDLFYAGKLAEIDKEKLIVCYKRYIKFVVDKPPTSKQFLLNLESKLKKHDFIGDLEGLLRPEIEFDENIAFDWVKNEIIEKL